MNEHVISDTTHTIIFMNDVIRIISIQRTPSWAHNIEGLLLHMTTISQTTRFDGGLSSNNYKVQWNTSPSPINHKVWWNAIYRSTSGIHVSEPLFSIFVPIKYKGYNHTKGYNLNPSIPNAKVLRLPAPHLFHLHLSNPSTRCDAPPVIKVGPPPPTACTRVIPLAPSNPTKSRTSCGTSSSCSTWCRRGRTHWRWCCSLNASDPPCFLWPNKEQDVIC